MQKIHNENLVCNIHGVSHSKDISFAPANQETLSLASLCHLGALVTTIALCVQSHLPFCYRLPMADLTHKQKQFIVEYERDRCGARAAVRAGYSPRSARVTACRLLANANIRCEIERRADELQRELALSRNSVARRLTDAASSAKAQGDFRLLLRAWQEIAIVLGYYPVGTRRIQKSVLD